MHHIIRVAIQGSRASFHEIAAYNYYKFPITLIYCESFEQVFTALSQGVADKVFVAVSNSDHGEIQEVTQLIADNELKIEGEYLLPIEQHVIGLAATNIETVETVISHPIALSQSSIYVKEHFSHVTIVNYHDTAAAVEYVKAQKDTSIVAVGSKAAAEFYGLTILRSGIQNDPHNATLFTSLSAKDISHISLML
jgi:prephenate dehydratase